MPSPLIYCKDLGQICYNGGSIPVVPLSKLSSTVLHIHDSCWRISKVLQVTLTIRVRRKPDFYPIFIGFAADFIYCQDLGHICSNGVSIPVGPLSKLSSTILLAHGGCRKISKFLQVALTTRVRRKPDFYPIFIRFAADFIYCQDLDTYALIV